MPTKLNKSDSKKAPIDIQDGALDINSTSLVFLGKNYSKGYTKPIGENFLHLLENFANVSAPKNPIQGQLWFNNNIQAKVDSNIDDSKASYGLKLFDGTNWLPIGITKKVAVTPTLQNLPSSNLNKGDLYVDTSKNQLYIFNGDAFTLIGPTFNAAEKTGTEIEYIKDAITNESIPVISIFVKTKRIVIISDTKFTPKSFILGFKEINQGVNLSTDSFNSTINKTKFWGIAEKAEALISGTEIVSTANFLRSDQNSTTNFSFNVRNNNGISIGNDLSFNLGTDTSGSYIYNKIDGASIDIRLRQNTQIKNIIRISSTTNSTGAVGINNNAPEESLDVIGNIKTSDKFISESTSIDSIQTDGGINAAGHVIIGKSLTVGKNITAENIEPDEDNGYTLGSRNKRWHMIYASGIGTNTEPVQVIGSLIGDVTGNISGTSSGFKLPVSLNFEGDIFCNSKNVLDEEFEETITFKNGGEQKKVKSFLNPQFISSKDSSKLFLANDVLLIERQTTQGPRLFNISKKVLEQTLPLVPVGTVILYAGNSGNLPDGYLACDGQEISKNDYEILFKVIGYKYKPFSELYGTRAGYPTFALPNLTPIISESDESPTLTYAIYTGRLS
jgi:hypothetical protein